MNRRGTALSSTELVSKLNEGGWIVDGGHESHGHLPFGFGNMLPVVKASLVGETLMIESEGHSFEVPSDNIAITDPGTVEIRHMFMQRQQHKKIDGGGWYEVPAVRVALRVSNPALKEKILKDREAQARCEKAEVHEAARQQFVAKLTSEFVGKKVTKIDMIDDGFHIEFEDGSELSAELDGGDICDAWINVYAVSTCVGKKLTKIDVIDGDIHDGDLHIEFEDGSKLSAQLDGGDTYDAWINVNNVSLRYF